MGLRCGTWLHHDLTAARELVLPALYPHVARGLPVLADKGYTGADLGVHTSAYTPRSSVHPVAQPLYNDNRAYNQPLIALWAPTEHVYALLCRWRALERVTICPRRITAIVAATLSCEPKLPTRSSTTASQV